MLSFEDMQTMYQNVGSHGQQVKEMSDMIMQQTFDTDIGTKLCYIYDYYHDDQFDEGLSGYNPTLSKTKIPVKLKFIIREYKTDAKDDPVDRIMFEPDFWNNLNIETDIRFQWFKQYSKLGVKFPLGLYVDIPDDRNIYHKWLICYDEPANQFPKFGVVRCNYLFTWIKDDGIHRYKRKMYGVERTQNSYTSGTWDGHIMTVLDEQGKFRLPWTPVSSEIKHDMRFFISMIQDEPYVYIVSKIKNTSPKGIITVTVTQDRFDPNKDYVDNNPNSPTYGEMYADYYSSTVKPEETDVKTETTVNSDILSIEAKTYKVRIKGGSKVVYAKILDRAGNDVTSNYNNYNFDWKFFIGNDELDSSLWAEDATYNANSEKGKFKFYFKGNEDYLNKRLTVKLSINDTTNSLTNNLSANADLDIVS